MSSGLPQDIEETKKQLKNPNPCKDGRTWLRHLEEAQSGKIDLMILEGKYSTEGMVTELRRISLFKKDYSLRQCLSRVIDHLNHLRNGSSRGRAHGMEAHYLKLKQVDGKWMYDL